MNIGYIYKITNKINNKCYIGQTSKHYIQRWNEHKKAFKTKSCKEYNYPIYKAFRKYGINNFDFEVLEKCNIEELNEKEIYWIKYYASANSNMGYNQSLGGGGYKILDLDENDVIEKYKEYKTIRKVAKHFNCSSSSISTILLKNNIDIISSSQHSKNNGYNCFCKKDNKTIKTFNGMHEAAAWIISQNNGGDINSAYHSIRNAILTNTMCYGYYWDSDVYTQNDKNEFIKIQKNKYKKNKNKNKYKNCPICGNKMYLYANKCILCVKEEKQINALKDKEQRHNVTRDILKQEIRTTSFTELGKKYGVSDNAIKKWCKTYNLPYKKSDINNYSDEEWENL